MRTQNVEREKIKIRIKALTEKTTSNGCTESEALSAAAMVGRLLDQYSLTMDEIDVREEKMVTKTVVMPGRKRKPIVNTIMSIAAFCGCKTWTWTAKTQITANFIGHERDVDMAIYLFDVIQKALRTELVQFKQTPIYQISPGKSATTSFAHGMTQRVSRRLWDMKTQRDAAAAKERPTGTALVVLKDELVEKEFDVICKKLNLSTVKSKISVRDYMAASAGSRAADRVNLNRPVGETRNALLG